MDDFKDEMQGVNTIEQLVASRGRIFFGFFFSTFTGYMNRIRGYHSVNAKEPGYEQGELPTTYHYATIDKKHLMHKSSDFPTSWRDINQGIGSLRTALQ
jgi:hypothetical protein